MGTDTDEPPSDHPDELQKRDSSTFSDFTRQAATVLAMAAIIIVLFLLVWELITLLLVLFLGVLLAILLRGLANHLTTYTKLNDTISLFVVTGVLLLIFGITGWLAAPAVGEQASLIADKTPEALEEVQRVLERVPLGERLLDELAEVDLGEFLRGGLLGPLGGAVFGFAGALSHGLFVIAVAFYLAYDPEVYKRGMVRLMPLHYRDRAEEIIAVCTFQLAWWLIGRLLAMAGVAIIITIGLWLLGIPLFGLLGLIAGLLSFVPILGPLVSFIPAALVAILVGPQYVIWVGLLFLGAQAVESYFITPVVQHRFVSLPHAMTLIAEIFAGILFGIIGITIATPLAVLIMALVNMIYVEDALGDTTPFRDLADRYHEPSKRE